MGEPAKEAGDEYFEVADGRVKFGWTRSDCYRQELLSPDEIKSDSLVAQIPFIPKEFLPVEYVRKIEQEMQPDSELFVVYFVDCLKGGSGTFSCSSLSRKYGFGYSHSNSGVSALFYYPTEIEADNLKEKLKSCTEK